MESSESERVFEVESANDLGKALVDSDRAGQENVPITGTTSTTPQFEGAFEGLFQASFFGRAALPSLPPSEPSPASGGGDGEAIIGGEESESGATSSGGETES